MTLNDLSSRFQFRCTVNRIKVYEKPWVIAILVWMLLANASWGMQIFVDDHEGGDTGGLTSGGYQPMSGGYGGPGFVAVPADYDGDGKADFAVYHEDTGLWELFFSTCGYQEELSGQFGGPTCRPVSE